MLKWIGRYRVQKEDNHVMWLDVYEDINTKVQYFGVGDSLSPRYNTDGSLFINK